MNSVNSVGRRKAAIARVIMNKGGGTILVNKKPLDEYFTVEHLKLKAIEPLHIVDGIKDNLSRLGLPFTVNHVGSMFSLFFTGEQVTDFETAKTSDAVLFGKYFQKMLAQGIYLAPSQFETLFISTAISSELVDQIVEANYQSLKHF